MYEVSIDNIKPLNKGHGKPRKSLRKQSYHTKMNQSETRLTDTKHMEEVLRESEKKYRTLVENLPQKIFHKDRNSVYVSCNRNYADDLKIRPDHIEGKTDYDFYPRALAEKYRADDKRVMKTGIIETIEEKYVHDGKKVIVQTVKAPIRDAQGNITGILGIFWDITDRKKVERTLVRYQRDLRALASQITSIEDHEREKCAAFLHDSIGQSLSVVKMKLGMLSKSINLKENKVDVDEILTIINHLIEDTRYLTSELRPPILHQFGLAAAIEWLIDKMNERESIMIELEDDGKGKPLDKNVSIILFRSVQELLTNIVQHAKAQKAKVSLMSDNKKLKIIVEDDGVGFNAAKRYSSKHTGNRFGLFSIEERLGQLGGKVSIESKLHHGTRVSLIMPFKDKTILH